jgi:TolB-like protein
MNRTFKMLAALAPLAAFAPVAAQSNAPVVAVLAFENGAFGPGAKDYDGIGKGIMDIVITDMASSNKVRVVDRERIQKILEEQNLTKSGAVDPNTAVRVGKLMGACYSVYGTYIRNDKNGDNTLTIHTTNNETGQIENSQKIEKKGDDIMALIAEASAKFISGVNVTACPGNAGARRGGDASPAQQGTTPAAAKPAQSNTITYSKALSEGDLKKLQAVKLDPRTMLIYSRALDARDHNDKPRAKQLAQQVLNKYKGFGPAEQLLESLSTGN